MPNKETFYVSTKDNKVRKVTDNQRSYFQGKNKGKAKMIISVFTGYNHKEKAKDIRDALIDSGISVNTISVDMD